MGEIGMNVGEIKKKASENFTEYLNYTIATICETPVETEDFFPLNILTNTSRFSDTLKEHSQDMVDIFLHSKNKIGYGYSLDMETVNTRSNGRKSIIKKVYFAEEDDYLTFINVKSRVTNLKTALTALSQNSVLLPQQLKNWANKHVKDLTIDHSENPNFWQDIAKCSLWGTTEAANQPQLNISPEFIESNKAIISSLMEFAESEVPKSKKTAEKKSEKKNVQQPVIESINEENVTPTKTKPFSIRFRSLSATSPLKLGRLVPKEIAIPLEDFTHLNQTNFLKGISTVLLVNSETLFQTFPASEHVLCVYGPDYAINALKLCEWFGQVQIIYFGDISEHCFDVLSAFRNSWPKAESLCMDGNTWEKFFQNAENGSHLKNNAVPKNLTDSEKNTFLALRLSTEKSKLNQEKIPLDYVSQFLNAIKVFTEEPEQSPEQQ